MRAALLLAWKDARVFSRDRGGLAMAFLLPVVLVAIFGVAMGSFVGGDEDAVPRARLALVDEAASEGSRALALRLGSVPVLDVRLLTRADAVREVEDGDVAAALVVPTGWRAGAAEPALELLRDPAQLLEQELVAGALLGVLSAPGAAARRGPASQLAEVPGLRVVDAVGPDEGDERAVRLAAQRAHTVAGIAVMMLLFGLVQVGGSVLEEERSGTLDRLRLARAGGGALLGGKFVIAFALGVVQLVVLFAFGALVFGVDLGGAPLALALVSAATAAAAAGFGMLLAALCRTQKQLEGLATLAILAMSALGGSWFPLVLAPDWLQTLGHLTLNAWAMDGYQDVFWRGRGLAGVLPEAGVLAAIALATGGAATWLWRRRLGV